MWMGKSQDSHFCAAARFLLAFLSLHFMGLHSGQTCYPGALEFTCHRLTIRRELSLVQISNFLWRILIGPTWVGCPLLVQLEKEGYRKGSRGEAYSTNMASRSPTPVFERVGQLLQERKLLEVK